MVVPDPLGLSALQLLQVQGQGQQKLTQVLAGKGESIVGLWRRGGDCGSGGRRGGGRRAGGGGKPGRREARAALRLERAKGARARLRAQDLIGEAMLEAAASAIQAKAKRAEGAANGSSGLPLFGLGTGRRRGSGTILIRVDGTASKLSTLNMQEVTAAAKGTHSK